MNYSCPGCSHPAVARLSVVFCLLLMVWCAACNNDDADDNGENADTDTVLDGILDAAEDNRWIPSECAQNEDCDDGDPCTLQVCARGQCTYRHDFIPMYSQNMAISGKVTDSAIIGNRLYVATKGAEPAVHVYNVPSLDMAEISLRESARVTRRVEGLDATWGGFVTAQGEGGIESFNTDNLGSPVYAAPPDEGVLEQLDIVMDVTISNSNVWVAGYEEGVTLLSGDLNAPSLVGTVDTMGRAVSIAGRGNSALVADSLGGAVTVYLDENIPVSGQPIDTKGRVVDVSSNRSSGILAEYGAGFSLVDLSRNNAPRRLVRVETDSPVVAVQMIGAQTALVFKENGEVMRVGFLNYRRPTLMEVFQLRGTPNVHGVDFYNAIGVVTFSNGTVKLIHNGCTYE